MSCGSTRSRSSLRVMRAAFDERLMAPTVLAAARHDGNRDRPQSPARAPRRRSRNPVRDRSGCARRAPRGSDDRRRRIWRNRIDRKRLHNSSFVEKAELHATERRVKGRQARADRERRRKQPVRCRHARHVDDFVVLQNGRRHRLVHRLAQRLHLRLDAIDPRLRRQKTEAELENRGASANLRPCWTT